MPTNTTDQQITIPIGTDGADNPQAFIDQIADIETRLVLKYANEADRTARHTAPLEGDLTDLAAENRYDTYTGTVYVSTYTRSLFAVTERLTDAAAINNSIVLVPDAIMTVALPIAGRFNWDLILYYDATQAADLRLAMTWPAGVTLSRWGAQGLAVGAGGTTGDAQFATATASAAIIPIGAAGVGAIVAARAHGTLTMGGTAGNFVVNYAQNTADVSNLVVRQGSRLHVWRVA